MEDEIKKSLTLIQEYLDNSTDEEIADDLDLAEEESDYYCQCGSCCESGCCSPLMCASHHMLDENNPICKFGEANYNSLDFGYHLGLKLYDEFSDNPRAKEIFDELWDKIYGGKNASL